MPYDSHVWKTIIIVEIFLQVQLRACIEHSIWKN